MADALSPTELYDRLQRGESLSILDVRNRDEFEAWHIDAPRTIQRPYAEFMGAKVRGEIPELVESLDLDSADEDGPVVAVCPQGDASEGVAELLREEGLDVLNLEEGMEGWAKVLVAREIDADSGTVVQYERPSSGCLSYLVISDDEAAVIDPLREFADRYVADAAERGADLRYAIDTHVHADHVSGIRAVAERSEATPVLPTGAEERGLAFDATHVTLVADGDKLELGDGTLTALHAPGHTSEMTLFRFDGVLFSADTLFLDGIGRPDLEAGSDGARSLADSLYATLHDRIRSLPGETLVAPGHVRSGTPRASDGTFTAPLSAVRDSVSLLSLDRDEFVARVADDLPPRPANYEEIVSVNLGRETVDSETAFELELGPNNCAV
ncbi:MBL fold metallo-hydrolase [Haladaptatus sp. AB618]|uniref:MBL fold metallo-hydrolase n=1 Tax=Haladaptatus sp. AB618 TaxID=2934173 RepID=UPI00209C43AC|nr:MBL fold metallo-hydrolase [Haladaptatus sp. AB618]MCO8253967.1 MBL fold metallo-hydrolase [Haladaptatus sp. AB618]